MDIATMHRKTFPTLIGQRPILEAEYKQQRKEAPPKISKYAKLGQYVKTLQCAKVLI